MADILSKSEQHAEGVATAFMGLPHGTAIPVRVPDGFSVREQAAKAQAEAFAVGDVVKLKHGGLPMTVERLHGHDNSVGCVWFDSRGALQHDRFQGACLVISGEPMPPVATAENAPARLIRALADAGLVPEILTALGQAGFLVVRDEVTALREQLRRHGWDCFVTERAR